MLPSMQNAISYLEVYVCKLVFQDVAGNGGNQQEHGQSPKGSLILQAKEAMNQLTECKVQKSEELSAAV